MSTAAPVNSVILVHGGFVDGSGWQTVYNILTKDGCSVRVAQHPTVSLAGLHGKVEVADLIRQATAGSGSGRPLARVR